MVDFFRKILAATREIEASTPDACMHFTERKRRRSSRFPGALSARNAPQFAKTGEARIAFRANNA
jgi:hypothetical protein